MPKLAAPQFTQYGGAELEWLNSQCFCLSLDARALQRALESELGAPDLVQLVAERCPYLFSAQPVFVSGAHIARMAEVIRAVESVVALPAWRELILADAPAIARHAAGGAQGVFFGYDFHLDDDGVRLIEINTNAGGAMLNAVLARAQRACCPEIDGHGADAGIGRCAGTTHGRHVPQRVGTIRAGWSKAAAAEHRHRR